MPSYPIRRSPCRSQAYDRIVKTYLFFIVYSFFYRLFMYRDKGIREALKKLTARFYGSFSRVIDEFDFAVIF